MLRKHRKKSKDKEKENKKTKQSKTEVNDGRLITFVIMGARNIGKTALVCRFTEQSFSPSYEPTVEDCYFKQIHNNTKYTSLNIRIIDTSGYYHFPAMQRLNIRHADVILLAYGVQDAPSVSRAVELYRTARDLLHDKPFTPIILVGTKIDLTKDTCNYENPMITELLQNNEDEFCRNIITSARLDLNVTDAFEAGLELLCLGCKRHAQMMHAFTAAKVHSITHFLQTAKHKMSLTQASLAAEEDEQKQQRARDLR